MAPSPACPSPEPCREAPLSPGPPLREKPAIPHLERCWDAARPWQQFCFSVLVPSLSCRQDIQALHGYPRWISQLLGHADPSCPSLNPSLMAKLGHGCPHPGSLGGAAGLTGTSLACQLHSPTWVLRKAFKVEKRLISTSLPLGVGALIAHEQKMKRNYSSGDTRQRDPGK